MKVAPRDGSPVPILVSSVSCAAENSLATVFSSDCHLCGTPFIHIPRLPVCQPCLSGTGPIMGGGCSVCGERLLTTYAVVAGQDKPGCGPRRKMDPLVSPAVAC